AAAFLLPDPRRRAAVLDRAGRDPLPLGPEGRADAPPDRGGRPTRDGERGRPPGAGRGLGPRLARRRRTALPSLRRSPLPGRSRFLPPRVGKPPPRHGPGRGHLIRYSGVPESSSSSSSSSSSIRIRKLPRTRTTRTTTVGNT